MIDIIRLKDWIIRKIETDMSLNPTQLEKLYQHYHRIKIWEAITEEYDGNRDCPHRN